jgi:hypothetical protein
MKRTILATLAVVAWAASAMAVQNQVIWVSDAGGGISIVPSESTSGVVSYTSADAFWTVVVSTGTASPPAGQGTLASPVLGFSVTATSSGIINATLHPLSVTFGADGFGPTVGTATATLSGNVSGTPYPVTFSTYSAASPLPPLASGPPAGTLLATGSLPGPIYNSGPIPIALNLAAPYALEEVLTIQAGPWISSYSLDGNLSTVPDGGTTAMLFGAALSILGLIRRKLA